MLVGARL